MSKHLKKILLVSVSAIMLASVGTGITATNQNTVHASRRTTQIAHLKRQRAMDYGNIKRINRELNRLEHPKARRHATHRTRHMKRTHRAHRHATHRRHAHINLNQTPVTHKQAPKVVHHESEATWYHNNGDDLVNNNINTNNTFRKGYGDGSGQNSVNDNVLNVPYANNNMYKHGWIVGYATKNMNGSKKDYAKTINAYKQGLTYASNNNLKQIMYTDPAWQPFNG